MKRVSITIVRRRLIRNNRVINRGRETTFRRASKSCLLAQKEESVANEVPENAEPAVKTDPDLNSGGSKMKEQKPTKAASKAGKRANERAAREKFHEDSINACCEAAQAALGAADQRFAYYQAVVIYVQSKEFRAGGFEAFCGVRGLPCTKATKSNVFPAVIRATFPGVTEGAASRQGRALKWVADRCKSPTDVQEYLRKRGGIQGCLEERAEIRRANRAQNRKQTSADRAKRISVSGLPADLPTNGSFTARIKVRDGSWEIMDELSDLKRSESPDAEDRLSGSIVAPEACQTSVREQQEEGASEGVPASLPEMEAPPEQG